MKKAILPLLLSLILSVGLHESACAWARANAWGGHSEGGWGGATHTNRWGGTSSRSWDGAVSHTNVYGGHSSGVYGYGAVHTTAGGASFYHPPTGYSGYGYHAPIPGYAGYAPYHYPVAVPYYHAGCIDCAGAVAAGAVVGLAAGAAIAHAVDRPMYPIGVNFASLPSGAVFVDRNGVSYYQDGATWFKLSFGANGVFYSVVAAP